MRTPQEVLAYWLDEIGPKGWYAGGADLDDEIRTRFGETWQLAADGALGLWLTCASETLAYIILTDQFSRNMFRGQAKAFDTDPAACIAAKVAIAKDWDLKIDGMARQFFYMPLMHSENLFDQDRAVRLICSRMPDGGEANLLHAKAHREIIRRFGRFPFRNEALGRATTEKERQFLEQGGYGAIMRELEAAA
ncbi:DUF924 family protein [Yoonia sp. R2331]|uniref:DUF924 family protein n=1 Tax=Yoonia sp. R2331 TaxID=3237238 RepID=UPI0034E5A01C